MNSAECMSDFYPRQHVWQKKWTKLHQYTIYLVQSTGNHAPKAAFLGYILRYQTFSVQEGGKTCRYFLL